jgi:hypothetical protein
MSDASRRKASAPKRLVMPHRLHGELSLLGARFLGCQIPHKRWEKSGCTDSACLRAVLLLCGATVPAPSWALWGLLDLIDKQYPPMRKPFHPIRWLAVREAISDGFTRDEAFEIARKN